MKEKNEGVRIAIAVFIVATTFTVMASPIAIPQPLLVPTGAFLVGLIVTAVFAGLFILAKGYELRYRPKRRNFIDRYNYIFYNLVNLPV